MGEGFVDATSLEVEEFLGVDHAACGAVGAFNVVSFDFESG